MEFARKCAEALVDAHNSRDGGSVRLFSFRTLCMDLKALGQQHCITAALKPTDFPSHMWFPEGWRNENK